jgi:hypothetical protein
MRWSLSLIWVTLILLIHPATTLHAETVSFSTITLQETAHKNPVIQLEEAPASPGSGGDLFSSDREDDDFSPVARKILPSRISQVMWPALPNHLITGSDDAVFLQKDSPPAGPALFLLYCVFTI